MFDVLLGGGGREGIVAKQLEVKNEISKVRKPRKLLIQLVHKVHGKYELKKKLQGKMF